MMKRLTFFICFLVCAAGPAEAELASKNPADVAHIFQFYKGQIDESKCKASFEATPSLFVGGLATQNLVVHLFSHAAEKRFLAAKTWIFREPYWAPVDESDKITIWQYPVAHDGNNSTALEIRLGSIDTKTLDKDHRSQKILSIYLESIGTKLAVFDVRLTEEISDLECTSVRGCDYQWVVQKTQPISSESCLKTPVQNPKN
jgi:hypothetical protein